MSGCHCPNFPDCMEFSEAPRLPSCDKDACPGRPQLWAHFMPKADECEHDFGGWREHKNEAGEVMGGEQVCKKCGTGAMAHTLSLDF